MSQNSIYFSKLQLYKLLVAKIHEGLSDNEAHIMYYLAKDKDIQKYLAEVLDDVKNDNPTCF